MRSGVILVLLAGSMAFSGTAVAQKLVEPLFPGEGGCLAEGQGPEAPGVPTRECSYEAQSDSQDVTAVTPNEWYIWVTRPCPIFDGCTPELLPDECHPVPDDPCEPRTDGDGNVILDQKDVTLLEGPGLPEDEIFYTVHPIPGEYVTVTIIPRDDLPPGRSTYGFVEVSDEEG